MGNHENSRAASPADNGFVKSGIKIPLKFASTGFCFCCSANFKPETENNFLRSDSKRLRPDSSANRAGRASVRFRRRCRAYRKESGENIRDAEMTGTSANL